MLVPALVIVCGLLLLLGFLLMPGESGMAERGPFWGRNYAHRGLHSRDKSIPENSLAAFTAAAEAGYGIELDIQLSADGQVVVFHDDDLKRVCGDPRRVGELAWKDLAALRLFDTPQRIPRLREVLDLVDGRVPLIVELKRSRRNRELCENAWKVLRTYDGDFCVESFDPRIVGWWRKKVPGILRGQLADSGRNLGGSIGCHLLAGLFGNFYARPQFVAFGLGAKPPTVRLVERFCMRVTWTVRTAAEAAARQAENDAVIFEFYEPPPRYKPLPGEAAEGEEQAGGEAEVPTAADYAATAAAAGRAQAGAPSGNDAIGEGTDKPAAAGEAAPAGQAEGAGGKKAQGATQKQGGARKPRPRKQAKRKNAAAAEKKAARAAGPAPEQAPADTPASQPPAGNKTQG